MVGIFFWVGGLLVILASMILMPNLDSDNWRKVLAFATVPAVIAVIFQSLFVDESPRFLAISGKFDEAIDILNKIAVYNKAHLVTDEEKELIRAIHPDHS